MTEPDEATVVEPTRRLFITEPGDSLLASASPRVSAERFGEWLEGSGMPSEAVLLTPIVSIPLPIYAPPAPAGEPRFWEGTNSGIMWHPLMWLPDRLANRYRITPPEGDPPGPERMEADDEWAIRVALELTVSNVYSAVDGSWLDVLSLVGWDADDPDTLDRIEAWMAGGADTELDNIDLTDLFIIPGEDEDWAVHAAFGMARDLWECTWAMNADMIVDICDTAIETIEAGGTDHDEDCWVVSQIAHYGYGTLREMSDEEELFWQTGMARTFTDFSPDDLVAGPLTAMKQRALSAKGAHWEALEDSIAGMEAMVAEMAAGATEPGEDEGMSPAGDATDRPAEDSATGPDASDMDEDVTGQ